MVKIYYTDSFGTSQSGLLIQVVSEYRWPLTQVSLYAGSVLIASYFSLQCCRGSLLKLSLLYISHKLVLSVRTAISCAIYITCRSHAGHMQVTCTVLTLHGVGCQYG